MIEEAEQIVYHVMHYGWPKQRASGWESPSTRERERERQRERRPGSERERQLPLLPRLTPWRPLPSTNWQSSSEKRYRQQLIPFFSSSKTGPVPFQTWKETPPEKLWGHPGTFVDGGRSAREMCPRFDATSSTGLWCGNKHIITAVRIPTLPQSVARGIAGQQSPFECHQSPNV